MTIDLLGHKTLAAIPGKTKRYKGNTLREEDRIQPAFT